MATLPYLNRDLSWLSFNERALDEADDLAVLLANRVKFLANLDEFFRVRVVALRSLAALSETKRQKLPVNPLVVLTEIADVVARQELRFDTLFDDTICPALRQAGIVLYRHEPLADGHRQEATELFRTTILAYLQPVFVGTKRRLKRRDKLPLLDSKTLYFALALRPKTPAPGDSLLAYLNIPKDKLSRFIELSSIGERFTLSFWTTSSGLICPWSFPVTTSSTASVSSSTGPRTWPLRMNTGATW